jgi:hypothetical protein
MQTFEQYLRDIHGAEYIGLDDDMPEKFETWLSNQDIDTLMDYANDYAKDCMSTACGKIHKDVLNKMLENRKEFGTDKHDWCYEECLEIVDNNLK